MSQVEESKGGTALVILSGGQDSTTCLFWARQNYGKVNAITFNYGQRHAAELEAARKVAELANVPHEVVELGSILVGSSPLVSNNPVGQYEGIDALPEGVEPTFVPARNPLFIVIAANRAAADNIDTLVLGLCEADFAGYYDCRQKFVDPMALAMSEALFGHPGKFHIKTPLMFYTKAEIVKMAKHLGPECWEALAYTHTCYNGENPPNPFNHASLLRAKGFYEAGEADPLITRNIAEGRLPADYPADGLVEGSKYGNKETWQEMVESNLSPVEDGTQTKTSKRKAKKSAESE